MPKAVSTSEAKNKLSALINWVREHEDEVIVESRGEPMVVIISVARYEKVRALRERQRRSEALERMRRLRTEVRARNQDLTDEGAEEIADRFSRELIEDLAQEGKIRFEP